MILNLTFKKNVFMNIDKQNQKHLKAMMMFMSFDTVLILRENISAHRAILKAAVDPLDNFPAGLNHMSKGTSSKG